MNQSIDIEINFQPANDFFIGGGETNSSARTMNWARTSLGEIESWSPDLKIAIQIMLNSRFPMFIWWGDDLTCLYNDAYLPILRHRHPAALGQSAREIWREIWNEIGPLAESVVKSGQTSWTEEMLLFPECNDLLREENYQTFSLSPIFSGGISSSASNNIGGLLGIAMQETRRVLSRRRLQTLSELGKETFAGSKTIEDSCAAAAATLEKYPHDLPFALIYLLDKKTNHANLSQAVRISAGESAAPLAIELGANTDVWNFGKILETNASEVVTNLNQKFGRLSAGIWTDDAVNQAFIMPLARDGKASSILGFFVAGISPRLFFDDDYRSFFESVAERIAVAIINICVIEEERAESAQAINASRETLMLAMRSSQMGAWSRDIKNDTVYWTPELEHIFGLEAGTFSGNINGFYDYVYQADHESLRQAVRAAISEHREYVVEFRFHHASGKLRWMEGRGRALYAPDGSPTTVYGIGMDITERKEAEAEREWLLQNEQILRHQAETANRLKDEFLATVSHELRTPLNAILGWTMIARKSSSNAETLARSLDVIERNGRNQNQLISNILDVSRIITGKFNLAITEVDLTTLARNSIESAQPALDAKKIKLQADLADNVMIAGDADRLQQIIWNLLSNALKFTEPGGEIHFSIKTENEFAKIVVSDTGEGITSEFLPFVFDRFRQADGAANRRHEGLGLGLALVRHLCELHNGSVSADSAGKNKGATFTVRLPLKHSGFAEKQEN